LHGRDLVGHHVLDMADNKRLALAVKESREIVDRELGKIIFLCKECHDWYHNKRNKGTKTWNEKKEYYLLVWSEYYPYYGTQPVGWGKYV
jgi:hypothetical protein